MQQPIERATVLTLINKASTVQKSTMRIKQANADFFLSQNNTMAKKKDHYLLIQAMPIFFRAIQHTTVPK
jgi:hypothetical protein